MGLELFADGAMVYPDGSVEIESLLTVVLKIPAAVDTNESVHMRSGMSIA